MQPPTADSGLNHIPSERQCRETTMQPRPGSGDGLREKQNVLVEVVQRTGIISDLLSDGVTQEERISAAPP